MSGSIGDSYIRTDARTAAKERTPLGQVPSIVERAQRQRLEPLVQPIERARTTESITLLQFYEVFKKVLESAVEMDGVNYSIRFTLEFPPVDTELPCFTTRLISRRPWTSNGVKEVAPRFMQEYEDPDFPGGLVQEFLRRQDNTIEITTWAKTSKIVNEMAQWVEDKYWEYLWGLQWGGAAHPIRWLGRGEDIYKQVREQQMYGAPMMLRVITGEITKRRVTAFRRLAISLGLLIEDRPDDLTP